MRQYILFMLIIVAVVSFLGLVEQAGGAPPWRFDANLYVNECVNSAYCLCDDDNDIAISWSARCGTDRSVTNGEVRNFDAVNDIADAAVKCMDRTDGSTYVPLSSKVLCYSVK